MTYSIFPTSPIWADITRVVDWNESTARYDSGAFQGSTNWSRPLHTYNINGSNFERPTQNSLYAFINSLQGMTTPFRIKDPYDYIANAVIQPTSTNMGVGSGFRIINDKGWHVLPDNTNHIFVDPGSGTLVESTHYVFSLDNGFIELLAPVSSVWISSMQYFRKVHFASTYREVSTIWENFSAGFIIEEIVP